MFLDKFKIIVYIIYQRNNNFKVYLEKNELFSKGGQILNRTVAIICEYNPFHNGHKYQIDKIKADFPNANIIAIMSGNVTQRGEFAIFDKYSRAKSAILNGVNAVFEIPYPFSAANAEIFAFKGVEIAYGLGADVLCFGSESNEISYLTEIANAIDTIEFEQRMAEYLKDKSKSYSVARELVLNDMGMTVPKSSNDILGVEYLRAIRKIAPEMTPYTVKRVGSGYKDTEYSAIMSAGAIRKFFYESGELTSVPSESMQLFDENIKNGHYLDIDEMRAFLFRNVLRSSPKEMENLFDTPTGCGFFIYETAKNCKDFNEFFIKLTSKSYTNARLRRIVMYLATNTTYIDKNIHYTTLLASDEKGRAHIKSIKKTTPLTILTKYSDTKKLNSNELDFYNSSKKADELYCSLLKSPLPSSEAYRNNAIVL